jgi:opacity protein-like surface antigen
MASLSREKPGNRPRLNNNELRELMKKQLIFAMCTSLLLGTATLAAAGAYGEPEQPIEVPAAPPAPPAPAPVVAAPMPMGPDYARTGWYLQGGVAYGFEDFDQGGSNNELGGLDVDDSFGYDVRAGYRLSERVAVEAQFQHFLEFDLDENSGSSADISALDADLELWAATVNGKFFFTTGRIQPYALAGIGYGEGEVDVKGSGSTSEGDFLGRVGLGVDAYATENLGIALEAGYIIPTGDIEDLNVIPVNLNAFWRF